MGSIKNQIVDPQLPKKFFLNRGVVSVLSALLLAPPLVLAVRRFGARNPTTARNIQVFMIVVGIIVFAIAIAILGGLPQAIFIGVSAAIVVSGLGPFVAQFVNRGRQVINR